MVADGDLIVGVDWPPTQFDADTTTQLNIADTTFTPGAPTLAVTFRAPTSGRVLVTVGAGIRDNSGAGHRGHVAPQIFEDSPNGVEVLAPAVTTNGVGSPPNATDYWYASRATLIENLDPGRVYFARLMYRVLTGTSVDIGRREIMIEPCP